MNSTLTCCIEPSTSISNLCANSDIQIISSLIADSMIVTNLELISSPLCQTREKEETIHMLSDEDRDCFLETFKNPPKPNQKLKDAFQFYYDTNFKDE